MKAMKNSFWILCCWGLLLLVSSCKSVIEQDLSDKKIVVNAPLVGSYADYSQTFWWEKMDGATSYQMQIVSTDFESIQKLILDTTVKTTQFKYTLSPGQYEWRVRGVNGSYNSQYNGAKITIAVGDIKSQYVVLSTPSNNSYVNASPVSLTWISLYGALGYQIQVDKTNTFTTGMLVNAKTPSTSYSFSLTDESIYYWRVRAYKGTDTSSWSSTNSFTYDVTPPNQVVLSAPANNLTDSHASSGTLTWTSLGAGIKYVVYIQYGSASEVASSALKTNSYTYSGTSGQIVKWRVVAYDLAGNAGTSSDQWQFKIQ